MAPRSRRSRSRPRLACSHARSSSVIPERRRASRSASCSARVPEGAGWSAAADRPISRVHHLRIPMAGSPCRTSLLDHCSTPPYQVARRDASLGGRRCTSGAARMRKAAGNARDACRAVATAAPSSARSWQPSPMRSTTTHTANTAGSMAARLASMRARSPVAREGDRSTARRTSRRARRSRSRSPATHGGAGLVNRAVRQEGGRPSGTSGNLLVGARRHVTPPTARFGPPADGDSTHCGRDGFRPQCLAPLDSGTGALGGEPVGPFPQRGGWRPRAARPAPPQTGQPASALRQRKQTTGARAGAGGSGSGSPGRQSEDKTPPGACRPDRR